MSDRLEGVLARLIPHIVWSGGACRNEVVPERLGDDYRTLVSIHDGLVALEGGLRVFGVSSSVVPDIMTWNAESGWRSSYRTLAHGLQFFAEDAFGDQFAFGASGVIRFRAETGQRESISDSLVGWLARVLENPDAELTLPVLRQWRRLGKDLLPSQHLCPTYPFVMSGLHDQELHAIDRYESMRFKGDFACQIRDLPEGSKVKFVVKKG